MHCPKIDFSDPAALTPSMPIHIAITRQVRAGCEAEFQQSLRQFFQASFAHSAVLGATMVVPPPGSESREFGILRTFTNEQERDDFYASAAFQAWEERCRPLVEGGWSARPLHGLEAWFRSPAGPPPRWKMALVTLLGVYPVSLLIGYFLSPHLWQLPRALNLFVVSALMVTCLTWLIMPQLTRWLKLWLKP
jgi:antibiotic biosynthesis monooxygenase (ABM) superfamily enzyme